MRIVDLAHKTGRAGSGGAWRSYHGNAVVGHAAVMGYDCHEIWHYSTLMLRWHTDADGVIVMTDDVGVYTSTGHGSVSDQQAMNRLFRTLNLPLYFSRSYKDFGIREV